MNKTTKNQKKVVAEVQPQPVKTSRSELVKLIKNSGGKFVTVDFSTKAEPNRKMNCMFPKHLSADAPAAQLGYLAVIAPKQGYKSINTRTIKSAKVGGVVYTV